MVKIVSTGGLRDTVGDHVMNTTYGEHMSLVPLEQLTRIDLEEAGMTKVGVQKAKRTSTERSRRCRAKKKGGKKK